MIRMIATLVLVPPIVLGCMIAFIYCYMRS